MAEYILAECVAPTGEALARHPCRRHWALAAAILGGAVLTLWWFDPRQANLPLCLFHCLTGLYCPGCGATRATHDLLHGRWLTALRDNPLWVLTLPAAVYATLSEVRYRVCGRTLPGDLLRQPWFFATIACAAVIFGVVRNIPSWPFFLLAPIE